MARSVLACARCRKCSRLSALAVMRVASPRLGLSGRLAAAFAAAILVACADRGGSATGMAGELRPQVRETASGLEISAGGSVVAVSRQPFRIVHSSERTPPVAEASDGLYFVSHGERVYLGDLLDVSELGTRVVLGVASVMGRATVVISFPLAGVSRVTLSPPVAAEASLAGERLASPPEEAVYGLIERTVSDYADSELLPKEQGSLDRRGTTVRMFVFQSVALYTPLFQTSRGYGVFVEGTTIGRYDLAALDPLALELEFELPPGVESLSYLFIAGPEHDRIVERSGRTLGRLLGPVARRRGARRPPRTVSARQDSDLRARGSGRARDVLITPAQPGAAYPASPGPVDQHGAQDLLERWKIRVKHVPKRDVVRASRD